VQIVNVGTECELVNASEAFSRW